MFLLPLLASLVSMPTGNGQKYHAVVENSSKLCADRSALKPRRIGRVICLRGEINQKLKDDFLSSLPAEVTSLSQVDREGILLLRWTLGILFIRMISLL